MSFELRPLMPEDAVAAAAIHAEGQPGTFLTSLGPTFLRTLYAQMASSTNCFGYVACEGGQVIGVATGTADAGAVFKELILRRGLALLLPVAGALMRRPALWPKVFQTVFYPAQHQREPGEGELLFIGTREDRRGAGVGGALFQAMAGEMRRRRMRAMGLTVDDVNERAKHFYLRNGMQPTRTFTLYGRRMQWFVLSLREDGGN